MDAINSGFNPTILILLQRISQSVSREYSVVDMCLLDTAVNTLSVDVSICVYRRYYAGFQFLRFCPVPSWHHLLFGIRFHCCVLYIRYWKIESRCVSVLVPTYHLWFPFIVHIICCIVNFIDNLRTKYNEYANSVHYVSEQKGRTRFPHLRFL